MCARGRADSRVCVCVSDCSACPWSYYCYTSTFEHELYIIFLTNLFYGKSCFLVFNQLFFFAFLLLINYFCNYTFIILHTLTHFYLCFIVPIVSISRTCVPHFTHYCMYFYHHFHFILYTSYLILWKKYSRQIRGHSHTHTHMILNTIRNEINFWIGNPNFVDTHTFGKKFNFNGISSLKKFSYHFNYWEILICVVVVVVVVDTRQEEEEEMTWNSFCFVSCRHRTLFTMSLIFKEYVNHPALLFLSLYHL